MEIWDGYRADGTLAGVDLIRGEEIPEGLYHLVCEVLVQHADGSFLLMRRSLSKPNLPGKWEASAGGSALKGESPEVCAKRELWEETGIRAESLTLIGRSVTANAIHCDYLCRTRQKKDSVCLQEGETIACRWVDEAAFRDYLMSEDAIPTQNARRADYYRKMGYIQ